MTVLEEGREEDRARLMGLFSGGQRAGSIVGVLLGGILFDLTGRLASFSIVAGLGLVGLPLVFGIVKRPSATCSDRAATSIPIPTRADAREEGGSFLQGMLLGRRSRERDGKTVRLLALFLNSFVFYFALGGIVVSTLGFFLNEVLGEGGASVRGWMIGTATLNGALLATNWIAALGGRSLVFSATGSGGSG